MPEAKVEPQAVVIAPPGWPRQPERTIFFEIAEWCYEYLRQPDGPNADEPWIFTDEQALILQYWFAFDELDRWLFRRGTFRLMKGWGKDPVEAVLAAVELCGPCRVENGRAIPHPAPWVQISAVSKDQTRSTMRLFPALLSDKLRQEHSLDVNKEIIYSRNGRGVIESITSSPDSAEGPRTSLALRNEIQNWRSSNEGHEMAEVIDGNIAKSRDGSARAISFCNAHVPGEDTVGEREWEAYQAVLAGRTRNTDILYYAREAPPDTRLEDADSVKGGLRAARGDSRWLDVDRLAAEIWDPRTTPSEGRRKYLNQIVASEDAWVAPNDWKVCQATDLKQLAVKELVTLGFHGHKSGDDTALIATRISDGTEFTLGVWDPDNSEGEAPRKEIDGLVRKSFGKYDVVGFYANPLSWESYVDAWEEDLGRVHRLRGLCVAASPKHAISWDIQAKTGPFTKASEHFQDAIIERVLKHDGDPRLAQHVYNARRDPNTSGLGFRKEHRESARKIDAVKAAVLSRLAYLDYLALDSRMQRPKRRKASSSSF